MTTGTGMDATDLELFAASLRAAVSATTGAELDRRLVEVGWADALDLDDRAATGTLFELQGETGATSRSLGIVLLRALGLTPTDVGVVLPPLGTDDAPATVDEACVPAPCVVTEGIGLADLRNCTDALVTTVRRGTTYTAITAVATLSPVEVDGLDPAAGIVRVRTDCVTPDGPWEPTPFDWAEGVAAAQRALAHELVGSMRTMLRMALEHAVDRVQFGRPIGSFQAVRHRLAEAFVAIEAAEAALDGAWVDGTPLTACVAKAVAGNSARTVRRHCQQVLAGIGFTTEHDLHRFVRRTMVLDALFGDARSLTERLGERLIADGGLPAILPL